MWHLSVSDLFHLIQYLSRSIHVVADGKISFFFMAESNSIVYMYHLFFTHSSIDGRLGCFYILAFVTNAATNIFFKLMFWVSSGKYPEMKLLGSLSLVI